MGTQMQFEIYIESAFTDEFDSQKAARHQLRSSSKKKICVRRGFLIGNVRSSSSITFPWIMMFLGSFLLFW